MKVKKIVLLLTLSLCLTACGTADNKEESQNQEKTSQSKEEESVEEQSADMERRQVFVSPEWVKSVVDSEYDEGQKYLVINVDWNGNDAYMEGHVPGAVYMTSNEVEYTDWEPWPQGDKLDDLTGEKFDPDELYNLRAADELESFMKKFGIDKDTMLILYGTSSNDSSVGRVAFACLYAGVENVKIMDGGIANWKDSGYPMETDENLPASGDDSYSFGTTIPAHPEYVLSLEDTKNKLKTDSNFRLVSIRSKEEFQGEKSGYEYIDLAGEPKGAVWGRNIGDYGKEDGTIVTIDTVKEFLSEANTTPDNEISFYCGTGWRATIPFLICYQEGIEDITLFDGGWYHWSRQNPDEFPVQKISPEEAAKLYSK